MNVSASKTIIQLALLPFLISSCTTPKPKLFSPAKFFKISEAYVANIDWAAVQGDNGRPTCIYHLVDMDVDGNGNVTDAKLIQSSSSREPETLRIKTITASKMWKFEPAVTERKARVGFFFRKGAKTQHFFANPDYPIENNPRDDDDWAVENKQHAKPIRRIAPQMPRQARMRGLTGFTVLRFDVTKEGTTENIKVTQSFPPGVFDRSAIRAIAKWSYEKNKASTQTIRLDYLLEGGSSCIF
ncbi:energy transducer TonB [Pseudobacteriovorax antillogorgiicola]|nr:energy transducer TonB [Pseudobacteriovorax antillogorgiicola]